jgi:hypothetical protein
MTKIQFLRELPFDRGTLNYAHSERVFEIDLLRTDVANVAEEPGRLTVTLEPMDFDLGDAEPS